VGSAGGYNVLELSFGTPGDLAGRLLLPWRSTRGRATFRAEHARLLRVM
jgi:hypothetical protein